MHACTHTCTHARTGMRLSTRPSLQKSTETCRLIDFNTNKQTCVFRVRLGTLASRWAPCTAPNHPNLYVTIRKCCVHAPADPTWPRKGPAMIQVLWGPLRSGEWRGHQGRCGCGEPQSQRGSPILYETGEVGSSIDTWGRMQ